MVLNFVIAFMVVNAVIGQIFLYSIMMAESILKRLKVTSGDQRNLLKRSGLPWLIVTPENGSIGLFLKKDWK